VNYFGFKIFGESRLKKMNSLFAEAREYYKKTEYFMKKYILYIKMFYTRLFNFLENKLQKTEPYYSAVAERSVKLKSFCMDLFLSDLMKYIKINYSKIDFNKKYALSSSFGIEYMFLILIALTLTGLNLVWSGSNSYEPPNNGVNILSTVKNISKNEDHVASFIPELEIFQQIIRHSRIDQPLALKLASIINSESKKYDIDPYLILSIIQVESRFSPTAVSHKGARGLMQLMPTTGRYVANKYDLPLKNTRSLFDPATNIRLGIAYLSYLENIYGNMDYALFAYNHGPKKTKQIQKSFRKSKPYYVKAVMNFKEFLETERLVTES
jgi:hypothetical protein